MLAKVRNFDVKNIFGVGDATMQKLHDAGINTIDLLAHTSPSEIIAKTGISKGLSSQHHSRAKIALSALAGIGDFSNIETCRDCGGNGVIYRDETCQKCSGTAKIIFKDSDPCIKCSGTGIFTDKKMENCTFCGGDGIVTTDSSVSCAVCRGTGVEKFQEEIKCNKCNGQGYTNCYYSKTCSQCEGDGTFEIWDPHAFIRRRKCPTCKGSGYDAMDIAVGVLISIFFPFMAGPVWALDKCYQCGGSGECTYYEGDYTSCKCSVCEGSGSINQIREVDCPTCIGGVINKTSTRPCSACGGDGVLLSTNDVRCSACNGLKKTLNVTREKCMDCAGSGIIFEKHELGCSVCKETGILKDFQETKCIRCMGEGVVADKITGFKGMNFETFVNTPTEDLVGAGNIKESDILRIKNAIGTLYFVLDEPCMQELYFE